MNHQSTTRCLTDFDTGGCNGFNPGFRFTEQPPDGRLPYAAAGTININHSDMARTSILPSLLRQRGTEQDGRVTFVELFFDLVFVFTIIQLSHTLAHHYTPLGVLETALLILAVWWVWIYTTWVTNWLDPELTPVRVMLFVLMFLGLVLSTSIPEAFGGKGVYFAFAYVGMQVGRSLFMVAALKGHDERNYRNFVRIACWLILSGAFWIWGAFADHDTRLVLWLTALAVEYVSPAAGFRVPGLGRSVEADWDVSGSHMAERCALFVIICLGETILATGRTFSGAAVTSVSLSAFCVAFLLAVAMWWIYFRFGHRRAAHLIESSDNPGGIARWAYTYAHIPIVAGIIISAVGLEFLLEHPLDAVTLATGSAVIGGPVVYLAGNILFKGIVSGRPPLSHLVGIAVLGMLSFVITGVSLLSVAVLTSIVMLGIATMEFVSLGRVRG